MVDKFLLGGVLTLRSKELDLKSLNKTLFEEGNSDALVVRGISEKREFKNSKHQSRSKSRNKKQMSYFIFHKNDISKELS